MPRLSPDDTAPNFELTDEQTMPWVLSGHLELGPMMLVFYRGDWCAYDNGQLAGLARDFDRITARGLQVAGISVDPPQRNIAMINKLLLPFPLLCDPQGEASRLYGLWDSDESLAVPAVVTIGTDGTIGGFMAGNDFADRPDEEEVSEAVESIGRHTSGSYESGTQWVRVGQQETDRGLNPERPAMGLEALIPYFDGALFSSGLISSRLAHDRSSRQTLGEVSRIEGTLRSYRGHLATTARLHGMEVSG